MGALGELVRAGFQNLAAARDQLVALGPGADELLGVLAHTADPDQALAGMAELVAALEAEGGDEARAEFVHALRHDEGTAMRLVSVLGASRALGEHLSRHPQHWHELRDPHLGSTRAAAFAVREGLLRAVGADPADAEPVATLADHEALDGLRVEYRRVLLRLAARDLAHHLGVDDAAAELSDLAAGTLDAGLAVARARVGDEAASVRFGVIAMGKCGGHELNYVSDVDVIFVHEARGETSDSDASRIAGRLASHLMTVCSDQTGEGTIWPVDANLRPEGRSGALSRTLASHRAYYERWAKTWEFQALLKARAVAGDLDLGREYTDMVAPMVWSAAEREGFVEDVQAMRRRVVAHIPAKEKARQLKLGPGGLRDVEFAVQLMQMVHGRADENLRVSATLSGLAELTRGGYVGREDGEALHQAYAFLRTLEHRIQLHQLRRTHVIPEDEESLRRLGRSLGFLKDPVARLDKELRHHRREVRRLHEKLFYRPLLAAVARISTDEARLTPEAAQVRLGALGYHDPRAALRHLEALTSGVSRTATIQRTLLPAMLEWFADTPDPDAGLWGFRRISESLGRTPWYLKTLRDEGEVAQRLAVLLGTSRYATDLLEREPKGVQMLGESLAPLSAEAVLTEMRANAARQDDHEAAVRSVRGIRRRELFRIAAGELFGETDVVEVGRALSRLTDATLEVTLEVALASVLDRHGLGEAPTAMAIVAMGRYGGFELSYGSDADVMFVHDPRDGADPQVAATVARDTANEVRRLLSLPATDPPLEVDADLRPEGK
ncbi:MAG: bifunctional [glutamine synthetase] adenylyltransferase/[glutamine synthetase]-adenylyl-L-tyrosine phosphorylase, partial [Nocardioides sp.]|uniref:bifunctional [glutamine synthetase] adenylyltransferase/[glutamine synthetase]-adenylyl-L-tyrosine phosphorylase n=1 Tax=Nocardioides sp. TaxID=35761 RepID=UPI003F105228